MYINDNLCHYNILFMIHTQFHTVTRFHILSVVFFFKQPTSWSKNYTVSHNKYP